MTRYCDIRELLNKTLTSVVHSSSPDEVVFLTTEGETFKLYHEQDCCEDVVLTEIVGDLSDLVGSPVVEAEMVKGGYGYGKTVEEGTEPSPYADAKGDWGESWTWTFYKLGTAKGFVTLRWCGTSNGYYSEEVNFCKVED